MENTPTLNAVSDMLRDALNDGPGEGTDLTPPVGAILSAIGTTKSATPRERPIRDLDNPWVCSVIFEGETKPRFLVGNAGLSGNAVLTFTDNPKKAMTANTQGWFTFCWPFLIHSHGKAIGKKPRAVVHRLKDKPIFA